MTNCNGSKMGNKFPTVPWPQPRNIFIHPLLLNCLYFLSIYLRRGDGTGGAEVSLIFLKIGEIVAFNTTNISRSKECTASHQPPNILHLPAPLFRVELCRKIIIICSSKMLEISLVSARKVVAQFQSRRPEPFFIKVSRHISNTPKRMTKGSREIRKLVI